MKQFDDFKNHDKIGFNEFVRALYYQKWAVLPEIRGAGCMLRIQIPALRHDEVEDDLPLARSLAISCIEKMAGQGSVLNIDGVEYILVHHGCRDCFYKI